MYKLFLFLLFIVVAPCCIAQKTTRPQFPGGGEMLDKYMEQQTALFSYKGEYAGSTVFFYVGADGKILRPTVATGYFDEPGFPGDSLALDIVKRMPAWVPGSVNGVPQEMAASVTVRFGEAEVKRYGSPIADSDMPAPVSPDIAQPLANEIEDKPEKPEIREEEQTVLIHEPQPSVDISTLMKNENIEGQVKVVEYTDNFAFVVEEDVAMANSTPFTTVEQMPTFPGGEAELQKYITKNLKYPVVAQENEIEGMVIVHFVVEADGKLSDVKVLRGVYPVCDQEAVRLMEASPKWVPGKQNGKNVRVYSTARVTFKLGN